MTSSSAGEALPPERAAASVEDLFADTEPVHSAQDLAREGVFDDDELTAFLSDLYAARHTDLA